MITIIPDSATVIEASMLAAAAHLHLITDGKRTLLSPIVPVGWIKISAVQKLHTPQTAAA